LMILTYNMCILFSAMLAVLFRRRARVAALLAQHRRTAAQNSPLNRDTFDVNKNYYDILGIPPEATSTEIREAFYRQARLTHPDVSASPASRQEFEYVQEAFRVLKNPRTRRDYDEKAGIGENLEQRAEDAELFWMTRRKVIVAPH